MNPGHANSSFLRPRILCHAHLSLQSGRRQNTGPSMQRPANQSMETISQAANLETEIKCALFGDFSGERQVQHCFVLRYQVFGSGTACDYRGALPIIPRISDAAESPPAPFSAKVAVKDIPGQAGTKSQGQKQLVRRIGMNRIRRIAGLAVLASLGLLLGTASGVLAQAAASGQDTPAAGKQQYTMPEYNAEQACDADKVPTSKVKCLDDFVSRYPTSYLLKFAYPMYYQSYYQLKNWAKLIEYADKYVALADKMGVAEIGPNERYAALYARAAAFYSLAPADQAAQAKGAIAAADAGLKLIADLKKPDTLDDKAIDDQKKAGGMYWNGAGGPAASPPKDVPSGIRHFKAC